MLLLRFSVGSMRFSPGSRCQDYCSPSPGGKGLMNTNLETVLLAHYLSLYMHTVTYNTHMGLSLEAMARKYDKGLQG